MKLLKKFILSNKIKIIDLRIIEPFIKLISSAMTRNICININVIEFVTSIVTISLLETGVIIMRDVKAKFKL